METSDVPDALSRLAETLGVLAAPAATQIDWSATHGCSDELALDYAWAIGWALPLIDRREPSLIGPRLRDLLSAIDDLLDGMSGSHNSDRWTDDALRTDPGWRRVRMMAGEALREMGPLTIAGGQAEGS